MYDNWHKCVNVLSKQYQEVYMVLYYCSWLCFCRLCFATWTCWMYVNDGLAFPDVHMQPNLVNSIYDVMYWQNGVLLKLKNMMDWYYRYRHELGLMPIWQDAKWQEKYSKATEKSLMCCSVRYLTYLTLHSYEYMYVIECGVGVSATSQVQIYVYNLLLILYKKIEFCLIPFVVLTNCM